MVSQSGIAELLNSLEIYLTDMLYSQQKCYCNACGFVMHIQLPNVIGNKWRVCSLTCLREMEWRETLSIMGSEYYPDPSPYEYKK